MALADGKRAHQVAPSPGVDAQRGSNASLPSSSSSSGTQQQQPPHNPAGSSLSPRMTLADHIQSSPDRELDPQVDANRSLLQRSSSPRRRSASPLRRVQIGRSGLRRPSSVIIRSINYFSSHECSSRDKNSTNGSGSSDSEDDANNVNPDETRSVRRLSVQDAISLFENKRRDSDEAPIKPQSRQESRRGSLESGDSCTSGKSALRRWNAGNDLTSEPSLQRQKEMMPESQGPGGKTHSLKHMHSATNGPRESTAEAPYEFELNRQEREGLRRFSTNNPAHNVEKVWQQSQPISANGTTVAPVASKQQFALAIEPSRTPHEEWQKQFRMELAKNLSFSGNIGVAPNTSLPSRSEFSSTDLSPSDQNDSTMNSRDARRFEAQGCGSIVCTPYSATAQEHANIDWRRMKQPEPKSTVLKETDFTIKDGQSFSATEVDSLVKEQETRGGVSLGGPWDAPLDFDMQTLVNMVDQQHTSELPGSGDEGSPSGQRGRFYEQYRKLRDAKLREEHVSKRAEREAKLKAMEETLDRRKAELEARDVRLSTKKNSPMAKAQQVPAEKLQAYKVDLLLATKKEREEEDGTVEGELTAQTGDGNNASGSPASPSSTPHGATDRLPSPRPQDAHRKTVQISQKSASTPRSSNSAPTSSPPRSTRKNQVRTPNQRKSAVSKQARILDNPLTRSVPCFAELRKENTKPSPGRSGGPTRLHAKSRIYSGRPRTVCEAAPLEVDGNISALGATPPPSTGKQDKKPRSMLTRKSYATASELNTLSAKGQEGTVLSPLKVQREGTTEPTIYGKIRRSSVAPIQEVKPFLRKGHGIGPGAGPGVMKLKASTAADTAKSSDEETPATPLANNKTFDPESHGEELQDAVNSANIPNADDSEEALGSKSDSSSNIASRNASDGQLLYVHSDLLRKSDISTLGGLLENVSIDVDTGHTIPSPVGSLAQNCRTSFVENPGSFTEHVMLDVSLINREDGQGPAPPQILTEFEQGEGSAINKSSTFPASSLPHVIITTPLPPTATSPSRPSVIRPEATSDYFSPPTAATLDSPLESPAAWTSSQIQHASEANLLNSHKKCSTSQKPVLIINQTPKEPAKGLKRLLKFGRKSRTSEAATTDWVSASTTSEGDDDTEEHRDSSSRSANEKMQERKVEFGKAVVPGTQYSIQGQGTAQSHRSFIPAPPANFKLREDHLSGVSLLKAPRSFFFLTSFRSRGSIGKSR